MAAELLTRAVASTSADSAQHGRLASRLADALYRLGDRAAAEQVANRVLEYAAEPDLLVDLHWTLAQCRMLAGESPESLASLERALAAPGISTRHRARLLALAARTHLNSSEVETAGRVAAEALEAASEAGDSWAMGWALLVMALVTSARGDMTEALPLFDRALAVTESDPTLTDLRLLHAAEQGRHAGQSSTGTRRRWPRPGRPGSSRTRSARCSGWLRRTAPWPSCSSRQDAGTTR